ncbi:MAG: dephospho-CoA kinase [Candidatus Marinimicrobia bacterium]|nr:dephospho-CoA kinase [Candidatus Neomarinimicrobiota bacterium]
MAKTNLKVALTGGIASGKSQVSALLEGYGCFIVDLDIIAREVVEPGTAGLNELIENFGKAILSNDGTLNRKYLRDELFKKGRNRALIEQVLHPKILQKMKAAMDACTKGIVIVVVPLLVEKNLWHPFDRAIVVDCEVDNQIKRLMNREHIDQSKAEAMLLAQASRRQRLKLNDHLPTDIIENNSKIADLEEKVANLYQKLSSHL